MKNKKWLKISMIIVVALFALSILKNIVLKSVVTLGASQVTGATVKIDKFSLGIFSQSVSIKGFKMYNPQGFPKGVMVDIPEITVKCDLPAIIGGKLHLPLIVLNLKQLILVRNQEGELNVDALKISQQPEKKKTDADKQDKAKKKDSKPLAMQIDVARLNLEQVIYKDYTKGDPPTVQAHDIGIKDKEYKNITSAQQFATIVMVQAMGPAAIKGAKIYAAATILGAGFLPVGVAGMMIAKDSGTQEFNKDFTKVFQSALEIVKKMGDLKSEDSSKGVIKAKIDGADVAIKVAKLENKNTEVTISARKLMMPKPEIAKGVLYELSERLK